MISSPWRLSILALALAIAVTTAGGAQIESEDLEVEDPLVAPEIEETFTQALEMFGTTSQSDSIPLFDFLIEQLEPLAPGREDRVLELYNASLFYRAQVHFNFGDRDTATADLETLIRLDPSQQLDPEEVSGRFAALYDKTRKSLVGFLDLQIDPSDAVLVLDEIDYPVADEPYPVLVGEYIAKVRRPGYTEATVTLEVPPDDAVIVDTVLERSSAVVFFRTYPSEVKILLDGIEVGESEGRAEEWFRPVGAASRYPASDFSAEVQLDDVPPGQHRLELLKPGYRMVRTTLDIGTLGDYRFDPVLLSPEAGTLQFRNLPSDAIVELNGQRVRPTSRGDSDPEIILAPGSYLVTVSLGLLGRYETSADVLDRSTVRIEVELRPALVMLGILGQDEAGARRLWESLSDAFLRVDTWAVLDRRASVDNDLSTLGIEAAGLRALARPGTERHLDWSAVQAHFDRKAPGSAYLVAVLDDDLLARSADLWLWPAGPSPAKPQRWTLQLDEPDDFAELALAFVPELGGRAPTIGALFLDSELVDGPVVGYLNPGGPAERSGLLIGDVVLAANGVPMDAADIAALVASAAEDVALDLKLSRAGELFDAAIEVAASYTLIDPSDPGVATAAVQALLTAELEAESEWPRWLLQMNQARLLLDAGEAAEAVRTLNRIDVGTMPDADRPGLGRGTLDYLLGLALVRAGARYEDAALDAFERATEQDHQRFGSADGPLIAPRARARVEALGGVMP